MQNDLLVSVIIIGYNIESYVDRCICAALNQDYSNKEIIFIDDGSCDNTFEVAGRYAENNVRCYTKGNGGIISARKAGLTHANGEYVVFVDGDDYINGDMLSTMVGVLDGDINPKPDIIMSDFWLQSKDKSIKRARSKANYGVYEGDQYMVGIMSDMLLHHVFPKLYRRQFLIQSGYLEFPDISIAEDLYTNVVLGIHNPYTVYLDAVNYYYQYNSESMTRKEGKIILEQYKTHVLIEEEFIKHGIFDKYMELLEYMWYSYVDGYIQSEFSVEFKKELFLKCESKLKSIKENFYYRKNRHEQNCLRNLLFDAYCKNSRNIKFWDRLVINLAKIKHGKRE